MKHLHHIIIVFCLIIIQFPLVAFSQDEASFKINTIVIDPGHGGRDPGAIGKFSYEKDLTLKLSLKFGELVKKNLPDVKVLYTRDKDEYVELYKRAKFANDSKADLFISVHINSCNSPKAYGVETFAMGLHVSESNLDVAKKENSVIMQEENYETNYEGFDPSSPESHIMFSMYANAYLDQSLNLAALMQDQFTYGVGRFNRGVKQAGFWVLHKVAMPSILIEAGFISNPKEEKFLNTEEGIDKFAVAMYNAFSDYKKAFEADNLITDEEAKELIDNKAQCDKGADGKKSNLPEFPTLPGSSKDEIFFRVQIGTSPKSCNNLKTKYPNTKDLWEYEHKGSYKHTAGKSTDMDEIATLQKKLRKKYPGCFVVAFKNDKRITVSEAKKALN